jgi:hypothetical protein
MDKRKDLIKSTIDTIKKIGKEKESEPERSEKTRESESKSK